MRILITIALIVLSSFSVNANAFGAEEYCVSYKNCKKDELIIIPEKYIIEICNINKNVVVANGKAVCYYVGERRTSKGNKS